MIERAVAAGTPARWVTGDEVYGNDPALRAAVAAAELGFVLAVAKSAQVRTAAGVNKAIDLAVFLPADAWQRLSAGAGAKGQRWYDWALIDCTDPVLPEAEGMQGLLVRRRIPSRPGEKIEYAFYRVHSPQPAPMAALVRVAGTRWKVEESFAGGKELTALDQHQVRSWVSWHRWTLFAMLAHAFLSVMTVARSWRSRKRSGRGRMISMGNWWR
jgi:SRSO17 transposase